MKLLHDPPLLKAKLEQFQFRNMLDLDKPAPFTLQQYEPGEIILHEGFAMQSLLFLVQGKIKVTSSIETGKSLLLRFGHPFSIIGDIELIRDVPVQSQIEAVNECLFIGLSFDYIRQHEMANSRFTSTLLDHLSYKHDRFPRQSVGIRGEPVCQLSDVHHVARVGSFLRDGAENRPYRGDCQLAWHHAPTFEPGDVCLRPKGNSGTKRTDYPHSGLERDGDGLKRHPL